MFCYVRGVISSIYLIDLSTIAGSDIIIRMSRGGYPVVLTQQATHRSQIIASGQTFRTLEPVRVESMWRNELIGDRPLHPDLLGLIDLSGLGGVFRLRFRKLDHGLITALVERWRSETHTFHFPVGETTVTLQDVEVLLGLRADGPAITGRRDPHWVDNEGAIHTCSWIQWVLWFLGIETGPNDYKGRALKISLLTRAVHDRAARMAPANPGPQYDPVALRQDARVLCALMIASLFPDSGKSHVKLLHLHLLQDLGQCGQHSWASAVLASLYTNLDLACTLATGYIGGPLFLLQVRVNVLLYFINVDL